MLWSEVNQVESVLQWTGETVSGSRSVGKSCIGGCEDQQRVNQSFSPLANDTPLSGSKSSIHHITLLLYVFLLCKRKVHLFFLF
jgi:hypothetical protein